MPIARAAPMRFMLLACVAAIGCGGGSNGDGVAPDAAPPDAAPPEDVCPALRTCVTIDLTNAGRVIPKTLFGDWIQWTDAGQGLWDPASAAPYPDLMAAIPDTGVTLLRYPGGTLSDFFDWSTAIGPVSARKDQIRPFDSSASKIVRETPVFGPDEFASVAKTLGVEMMITVNVGSGTADSAAAWVAHQQSNGGVARYWEVGNEVYLAGDGWAETTQRKTPEQYAAAFDEYAAKMRAVDPSIRIGALGCHDLPAFKLCQDAEWDRKVLTAITQKIDFLAVHDGYAPILDVPYDPARDEIAFRTMLSAPESIREDLEAQEALVAAHANAASKDLEIAITEHAALFYPDAGASNDVLLKQLARTRTLAGALFSAALYDVMIADPRVGIANHSNLWGPYFQAALLTDADVHSSPRLSPFFHVLRMYAEAAGGKYVPVTLRDVPTFDADDVTLYKGRKGVPMLHAVAVTFDDHAFVYVVNRDLHRDSIAGVKVAGRAARSVVAEVLGASDFSSLAASVATTTLPAANEISFTFPRHSLTRITIR